MIAGDIVAADFMQSDGSIKRRPAILLRAMPLYNDWLICGISGSLNLEIQGFDILLLKGSNDFETSGLDYSGLIRLGFLSTISKERIIGVLGNVSPETYSLLINRLINHLKPKP